MTAYVDMSAFDAAADRGDASHERAKALLAAEDGLVTSDHVLVETWTLLRHRLGRSSADRFWTGVRAGVASVETEGVVDLEAAWSIGEAFGDQDFSIVDRTSFAAMVRLGLGRVVTFDHDFSIFRFGRDRDHAFQVLR